MSRSIVANIQDPNCREDTGAKNLLNRLDEAGKIMTTEKAKTCRKLDQQKGKVKVINGNGPTETVFWYIQTDHLLATVRVL